MEPFQVLVVISARGKDNESDTEAESGRLDTNTTQYFSCQVCFYVPAECKY